MAPCVAEVLQDMFEPLTSHMRRVVFAEEGRGVGCQTRGARHGEPPQKICTAAMRSAMDMAMSGSDLFVDIVCACGARVSRCCS